MVEAIFCAEIKAVPPGDISVNWTVGGGCCRGPTTGGLESAWGPKTERRTAGVWQSDLQMKSSREQVGILTSHPNCILPDILTAARGFRDPEKRGWLARGHTVSHGRPGTRTQDTKATVGAGIADRGSLWERPGTQGSMEARRHQWKSWPGAYSMDGSQ